MRNAKRELIEHIGNRNVTHVSIAYKSSDTKFYKGSFDSVIDSLDFSYDDGYGDQELYGYIWYNDGTWSERVEYDGSEWWQYRQRPDYDVEIEIY